MPDAAPRPAPAAAPVRTRSPAAIRQARCRRRARLGLVAVVVELPADRLAEFLISKGVISEDESTDPRMVTVALNHVMRRLIGA